jgi:hypothetical protein
MSEEEEIKALATKYSLHYEKVTPDQQCVDEKVFGTLSDVKAGIYIDILATSVQIHKVDLDTQTIDLCVCSLQGTDLEDVLSNLFPSRTRKNKLMQFISTWC